MKLIKPRFEIIEPTGYTIDDIYKSIELAGRVSHKSEDKITETSAKAFVGRMLNMKHLATCEFGTVYLTYTSSIKNEEDRKFILKYIVNPYTRIESEILEVSSYGEPLPEQKIGEEIEITKIKSYITTNYRVLVENNWLDDLQYLCEPTEYHHKRYTVKFTCSRSISHEFVRHRTFSFMQESQRYCNYHLGKFNKEITCIHPIWFTHDLANKSFIDGNLGILKHSPIDGYTTREEVFIRNLMDVGEWYMELLDNGLKPEEAREILPNATKTELYMCGFAEDWKHFFELRDDKQHAHPQAYELAHPLHEEFIKRGYL